MLGALDDEAATDGWYARAHHLPADIDAAGVLRRYKGQKSVERHSQPRAARPASRRPPAAGGLSPSPRRR